jgi:flagellin
MSLSFLTNLSAVDATNALSQTWGNMQNELQQVSSGQRINSAADDPAGMSMLDEMGADEANLTQQQQNDSMTEGGLQVASGALGQVNNLLDNATTLATEAANGTMTPAQEAAANQDYQSTLDEINNIDTTTDYNGSPVFANQTGSSTLAGVDSSLGSTNLSTPSAAANAETMIKDAVSNVASQEGSYGAQINATNDSSAVAENEATNTQAAMNAIDATDYAQVEPELSQNEIATQMGMYALAQSYNIQQQEANGLFGGMGSGGSGESMISLFA